MELSILTTVHGIPDADLELCIESSLAQVGVDLELILFADNATERNLNICKSYAEKDTRVRLLQTLPGEHLGPGASLNRAITFAKGEFVGVIDGDDSVDDTFYSKLLHAQKATQAGVVKGNCLLFQNGSMVRKLDICNDVKEHHYKFSWQHWSAIYSRSLLTENGILWFPGTTKNAETAFLSKLCAYVDDIAVVPDAYYHYNRRPTSVDSDRLSQKKILDSARVRVCALDDLIRFSRSLLPGHLEWYANIECLSRTLIESVRADSPEAVTAAAAGLYTLVTLLDTSNIVVPLRQFQNMFPDFNTERLKDIPYIIEYIKKMPYKTAAECS